MSDDPTDDELLDELRDVALGEVVTDMKPHAAALERMRAGRRLTRRVLVAMVRAGRELASDQCFRADWCATEEALDRAGYGWVADLAPVDNPVVAGQVRPQPERVARLAAERDRLAAIVRDLAACAEPTNHGDPYDDYHRCALCGAAYDAVAQRADHAETCPWRRAKAATR